MSDRDKLIRGLHEEIDRLENAKFDDRHEYDMARISLSALNTRYTEHDRRIAEARAKLDELQAVASPVEHSAEPVTEVEGERWDVFISYQRESETEAREVHERLTAAGLRVWQDVNNIRHTDLWPMAIDNALAHSDRLVLLLTPEIRQSNEVFNEWFYFYQQRKPIHCLMVETCVPHYQLLPYQYLDWRDPANRDWERLLRELRAPFESPAALTPSPIVRKPDSDETAPVSPFADLLQAARDPNGSIALTEPQIKALAALKPVDLAEYRLARVAEWSQPRYALDTRFVHLTLLLDKGENDPQRWQPEDYRFNDLRDVLAKVADPALVLLGAPGSGKSTLLRRLQMDHSLDQLRDDGPDITFFIQLNGYRGEQPPHEWLNTRWHESYPHLPVRLKNSVQAKKRVRPLDDSSRVAAHPGRRDAEWHPAHNDARLEAVSVDLPFISSTKITIAPECPVFQRSYH